MCFDRMWENTHLCPQYQKIPAGRPCITPPATIGSYYNGKSPKREAQKMTRDGAIFAIRNEDAQETRCAVKDDRPGGGAG